ncbi:hypothetical protein [Paucihalobacter sp.]|uniref:hypothetical protein n=1 Tax=Paucihalobacter sp. TaxID=2850405 RepID=UPI002FE2E528
MKTKKRFFLVVSFIITLTNSSWAQTKVEVLPKDKKPTPVQTLPEDKKPTVVEALPEETITPIPILADEPDLDDLLDINFPNTSRPSIPNAGMNAQNEPDLLGSFQFDRKITYTMNSMEGNVVSHFYFDTKSGTSYKDPAALQDMMEEKMEMEMHQIFTSNGVFFQYKKSPEMGNIATKMDMTDGDYLLMDLKTLNGSKEFFKNFKPTGIKKPGNSSYNIPHSLEYAGFVDGKKYTIYLADAGEVMLHTGFTYALTGYAGLGYFASPSKRTYMVVGFYGEGTRIYMERMEKVKKSFSAKGYQPIGDMMAGIQGGTPNMHQFEQTNNMADLANTDLTGIPSNADLFDMAIKGLEQSVFETDRQITEAQNQNNNRVVNSLKCNKDCALRQLNLYKRLKSENEVIYNRYANDEDKRDEEINKLMERLIKNTLPCNCN